MNLIKIKFTCEVMFLHHWAVYLNDTNSDNEPAKRTNIKYVVTDNKTSEVKLTFDKGIMPTSGGQPFNDIWIEFESSQDNVMIKDLWWAIRKGEYEVITKKADKSHLKVFNDMLQQFPSELKK